MTTEEEKKDAQGLVSSLNELFADFLPQSAKYLYYWTPNGDEFHYTTETVKYKGRDRYAAGVYRYYKKSKKLGGRAGWVRVKKAYFASRWRANEWAYKEYCKATGEKYVPQTEAGLRAAGIDKKKQTPEEVKERLGRIFG